MTSLRHQGIPVEYAVEVGSREEGIVATTRDRQVDLILLVPVHRQGFELLWYSHSATRLLHELPAPLLIWPESQAPLELLASREAAVLVPLDGAPESERSLPCAMALAQRYHQPLVLVRAIPTGPDGPTEIWCTVAAAFLTGSRMRSPSRCPARATGTNDDSPYQDDSHCR